MMSRSSLPSPGELVDSYSENHQDARDQNLIDRIDADELQTIAEDADDEHADQRAHDPAASAEETRPAEHDRGDARQVLGLPRVRIADVGAANEEQGGYAVEKTSDGVNAEQQGRRVDAAQASRLGVVSHGIDVAPNS